MADLRRRRTTASRGRAVTTAARVYDRRGVLGELAQEPVEFALDEELRAQIRSGQRRRPLKNVSLKLDPMQIAALRKIAATKSVPYRTLIRMWLAERIRAELRFPLPA
ncbi:MAG TPA: hypothetical protein VGQ83_39220 [Polyangia bacterium]|jgi:hypothetical protein